MRNVIVFFYFSLFSIVPEAGTLRDNPLKSCAEHFINGNVENAPTIGGSLPTEPFDLNQHLCYRDDNFSFFAIEYWPKHFTPRWAAYKLDPVNFEVDGSGTIGCNTYTRKTANCYFKKNNWNEFVEDCIESKNKNDSCDCTDPFHRDVMVNTEKLNTNSFRNTSHDRGHLAPRNAFSWHVCGTYQSFSMANMSPQRANFNQEIWNNLEQQVLGWAVDIGPLYVVTGAIFKQFPFQYFDVYRNETLDRSKIYSDRNSMSRVVEQILFNNSLPKNHPNYQLLKSNRIVNPSKLKENVKNFRLPTGYYKVIYRPPRENEPAHAIGFLLPHTFENLNKILKGSPKEKFMPFFTCISLIEEVSETQFPGIPENMKNSCDSDKNFFIHASSKPYKRSESCGIGTPKGVDKQLTSSDKRKAACTDIIEK